MLTDPGVDRGAAHSGSERLSGAFSVGDREGWPTAIVGLMCLTMAWLPTWQGSSSMYTETHCSSDKLLFNFVQPHAAKCRARGVRSKSANLTNGHRTGVRFRSVSVQVRPLSSYVLAAHRQLFTIILSVTTFPRSIPAMCVDGGVE